MREKKYIYYVLAIDFDDKNEKILEKQYEEFVRKYKCNGFTYDDFLTKLKYEGRTKYEIESFISSYHLDKEVAIEYATKNIADINEAGCYNYVAVVAAPVDCAYYNSEQNKEKDFDLFKYDRESDTYKPLDRNVWEYNPILYHCWGMYFNDENLKKE